VLWADRRGIRRLRPRDAEAIRVSPDGRRHPTHAVGDVVRDLGFVPRFIHSTSWRYEGAGIVLTYVAVVDPPRALPGGMVETSVRTAELARARALDPPPLITTDQVVEHTLRHLAWLVREDPEARAALHDWDPFLVGRTSEPFRGFDHLPPAADPDDPD